MWTVFLKDTLAWSIKKKKKNTEIALVIFPGSSPPTYQGHLHFPVRISAEEI